MDALSLSSDCRSNKQTAVQVLLKKTRESVTEIFSKYRQKVGDGARQAVQRVRSRQLVGLIKPSLRCTAKRQRFFKNRGCEEVASGFLLILILLICLLGLYLARNYNHAFVYGSGGCLSTFLWTYDECQIIT
ncbi:uncharacterized protein LOC6543957 [Drosophila erecta]|uniref:Uncharacterized protein n=1 Tax=Drosophila erecta TaxID=7220 RepID=B3NHJ4_DROER|nr:uncharacterized protein LOC6543957 [Drosophila erecta]EDV51789.1 uncharacterized protein Dere_GG13703 [Drosophila erecta]